MQDNCKSVIPSEAGRFFLALRSREASDRVVEELCAIVRILHDESLFRFCKEKT